MHHIQISIQVVVQVGGLGPLSKGRTMAVTPIDATGAELVPPPLATRYSAARVNGIGAPSVGRRNRAPLADA